MKTLIYLIAFLPIILFGQNKKSKVAETITDSITSKIYSASFAPELKKASNWENIKLNLKLRSMYKHMNIGAFDIGVGTEFKYSINDHIGLIVGVGLNYRHQWDDNPNTNYVNTYSGSDIYHNGTGWVTRTRCNFLFIETPVLIEADIFKIKSTKFTLISGLTPQILFISNTQYSSIRNISLKSIIHRPLTLPRALGNTMHDMLLSIGLSSRKDIGDDYLSIGMAYDISLGRAFSRRAGLLHGVSLKTRYNF